MQRNRALLVTTLFCCMLMTDKIFQCSSCFARCNSEVWLELTTLHFFPSSSKTGGWFCWGEFLGEVGLGVWLFVGERTGGPWARRLGFLWVFWSSETCRSPKKQQQNLCFWKRVYLPVLKVLILKHKKFVCKCVMLFSEITFLKFLQGLPG